MAENNLPPLPSDKIGETHQWREWFFTLRQIVKITTEAGSLLWSGLNFTGSNITDIVTRNHSDLQNLNTTSYSHLTSTQLTDLTDTGDSSLHYHASDRDTDNHVSGTTNKVFTATEQTKLAGIEAGAEVNNISDVNATDLTDGGETTLHAHKWPTIADVVDVGETVTIGVNRQLIVVGEITNSGTIYNDGMVYLL